MKVLDRYLTRELLMPVLCCAFTLVLLVLVADLFDNIDDFLTNKVPVPIMLKYYLAMMPHALSQILAWATWLGTVFLLVSFGLNNETMAMKAAGLKVSSIMRPVLFIGFLAGILVFVINDRVLPSAFRTLTDIRDQYVERKMESGENKAYENVAYLSGGTRLYYFRKFIPSTSVVKDAVILWLDDEKDAHGRRWWLSGENGTEGSGLLRMFWTTRWILRAVLWASPRLTRSRIIWTWRFTLGIWF